MPKLSKGDIVNTDFKPTEKETTPPKHYTVETLNNYLKNPFREDKAAAKAKENEARENDEASEFDDEEDYKAIFEGLELGTEATRTGIIDNARKSEYIELKKDVYTILPQGIFLIESLSKMQIIMDKYKTSELGKALKKIFRGNMTVDEGVLLARQEIAAIFAKDRDVDVTPETDMNTGCFGDIVGKCPLCGADVMRGRYYYGCRGYKDGCAFKVGVYICNRAISVSNVKLLLEQGRTAKIAGFVSKRTGKTFEGRLKLENGNAVFDFSD